MKRSVWKFPFTSSLFLKWSYKGVKSYSTQRRDFTVLKSNVHKKVRIYNGKKFINFYIRPVMVGHKLGEFALTKIMGSAITLSKAEKAKSRKRG